MNGSAELHSVLGPCLHVPHQLQTGQDGSSAAPGGCPGSCQHHRALSPNLELISPWEREDGIAEKQALTGAHLPHFLSASQMQIFSQFKQEGAIFPWLANSRTSLTGVLLHPVSAPALLFSITCSLT